MTVIVNGEEKQLSDGATLADLVREAGLADAPCAAEVNESLIPRSRHAGTALADGDKIELVTLVGGG